MFVLMQDAAVRKQLREGCLEPLLAADQLCVERGAGRVFQAGAVLSAPQHAACAHVGAARALS